MIDDKLEVGYDLHGGILFQNIREVVLIHI